MTSRDTNTEFEEPEVPPACAPTVDRLQRVLDGEVTSVALESDPHAVACPACRDRIAAARLMLSVLATPSTPIVRPALTDAILSAVREDRFVQIRKRSYAATIGIGVAIAASILIVPWLTRSKPVGPVPSPLLGPQVKIEPAPEPRPVRIGDEFVKVGQALRDTSKPITGSALGAPDFLVTLTGSLTKPVGAGGGFEPARRSLADLPDAARIGLEPVTATTQKAFARLMRDVGAMQVSTKPKS